MLVVREQSVNMASKTILLLLIGTFAVEVFSVNNCRPDDRFVRKHVCTGCSNIRDFVDKALHVERTEVRSELAFKQTIYSTRDIEPEYWKIDGNKCKSKKEISRYLCTKRWTCRYEKDDKAKHRKGQNCPEKQILCTNCLKKGVTLPDGPLTRVQPLEENKIDPTKVRKKVEDLDKAQYQDSKTKRKLYTPVPYLVIHVLKNDGEALTAAWESTSDRQFCQLRNARPKYECNSEWVCSSEGKGHGTHHRNDGHLAE